MGGKSSSSSSQSTATTQIDKRIGATDNAVVLTAEGGSNLTLNQIDGGALDAAEKMLADSLGYSTAAYEKGIAVLTGAIDGVNKSTETAFNFADKIRQDADERNYKTTVQWVAVVAIIAFIAWGYRRGR